MTVSDVGNIVGRIQILPAKMIVQVLPPPPYEFERLCIGHREVGPKVAFSEVKDLPGAWLSDGVRQIRRAKRRNLKNQVWVWAQDTPEVTITRGTDSRKLG